jgi:hypothetical protein
MSRWVPRFFGLTPSDRYDITREGYFTLMYYLGVTLSDCQTMPLRDREWYISRLAHEFKKRGDNDESPPTRAAHDNTAETRALRGMARDEVPARHRRFT